jgi:hypothetical protein
MTVQIPFTAEDRVSCAEICERVPGYSGELHYAFFISLLTQHTFDRMLMLGCYRGRDLCFLLDILRRRFPDRKMTIVGVDKFSNDACGDWAPDRMGMTWEQAGYGLPPSLEEAQKNISVFPNANIVTLVKMDDARFLAETERRFNCFYYDTSHDGPTVDRQLRQTPRIAEGDAILCGDDFTNENNWGVKKVVGRSFTEFTVFAGYVWKSRFQHLKFQVGDFVPQEVAWTGAEL